MSARQLLFGAALLAACPARAQEIDTEHPPTRVEPSRSLTLEFKLGPYKPLVSREAALNGNDPYKAIFGDSSMLLFEIEVDWIFWQEFGTLGLGGSIGYAGKTGYVLIAPGSPGEGTPGNETTALRVVPIRLMLVYRLDYGALHLGIPLVPYGKAGLVSEPWWSTKGGSLERADGHRALGVRYGYDFTGGISLMLDPLEPRMAKDLTTDLGVAHSYLFAEYTYANVNTFGKKGLDLSSRHWMFGLSLDF